MCKSCVLSHFSTAPREMVLLENEQHHKGFSMTLDTQKSKCSYSAVCFLALPFGPFLVNLIMIASPFLQMGADSMLIFLSYLFLSCSVFCVGRGWQISLLSASSLFSWAVWFLCLLDGSLCWICCLFTDVYLDRTKHNQLIMLIASICSPAAVNSHFSQSQELVHHRSPCILISRPALRLQLERILPEHSGINRFGRKRVCRLEQRN